MEEEEEEIGFDKARIDLFMARQDLVRWLCNVTLLLQNLHQ